MEDYDVFFRKSRSMTGGYYIPVRNSINFHIQYEYVSEKEKDLYEEAFGHQILTEKKFHEWWEKIHRKE